MKRIFQKIGYAAGNIPADIKHAMLAFLSSSVVMCLAISGVRVFSAERENTDFSPTSLEPYIESAMGEDIPADTEAIECSASGEIDLVLLAGAIERAVPFESYAVRVSFGAVLINRARDEKFPQSLSSVIKHAGLYSDKTSEEISERTLHAARDALLGVDPTFGALYVINVNDAHYPDFKERVTAIYSKYAFLR